MKEYYVNVSGKQYGPFSESAMKQMLEAGQLSYSAICWCQGMAQWQPVSTVIAPQTPPPIGGASALSGRPDNNMVKSILVTLFCCLPLGIVAIVKSAAVDTCWNAGRYEEAIRSAEEAKKFCTYSLIAGLAVSILYFLLCFMGGVLQ